MEIIYSSDFSLIKLKIDRLTKLIKDNLITLSFIDHSWNQIETALITNFLGSQKRGVILEDAFFLASTKTKLHETFNLKQFWLTINNLNPNVTVILTVVNNKLLSNWPKNLVPTIHQLKPLSRAQLKTHLSKKLKIQLEDKAIEYFLDQFYQAELKQIDNEIDKINHLYSPHQLVTLQELHTNLVTPINFDIFKMSSSFINGNLNQFLKTWESGFDYKNNTQQLLGLLTKQLTTLWWYDHYHQLNFSDSEIAKHLGINPYYLKQLVATNSHQIQEINGRISYIYSLNKDLLLGKIDSKVIPEYLFLKMFPQVSEREK